MRIKTASRPQPTRLVRAKATCWLLLRNHELMIVRGYCRLVVRRPSARFVQRSGVELWLRRLQYWGWKYCRNTLVDYWVIEGNAYWSRPSRVPKWMPGPKSLSHVALETLTNPSVGPKTLLDGKTALHYQWVPKAIENRVQMTNTKIAVGNSVRPAQLKYLTSGLFTVVLL